MRFGRNKRCSLAEQQPSRTVIGGELATAASQRIFFGGEGWHNRPHSVLQAGMCVGPNPLKLHSCCIWQRAWHAAPAAQGSLSASTHCQHPTTANDSQQQQHLCASSPAPILRATDRHRRRRRHRRNPGSSTVSPDPRRFGPVFVDITTRVAWFDHGSKRPARGAWPPPRLRVENPEARVGRRPHGRPQGPCRRRCRHRKGERRPEHASPSRPRRPQRPAQAQRLPQIRHRPALFTRCQQGRQGALFGHLTRRAPDEPLSRHEQCSRGQGEGVETAHLQPEGQIHPAG